MCKLGLLRGHTEHWRMAGTTSLWDLSSPHHSPHPERHRLLWVICGRWDKESIPKTCTFRICPSSPLSPPRIVPIVRGSRATPVCVRFVATRKWNKFCNFIKCASIFWCFSPWVTGLQVTVVVQAELDPFSDIGLHRTWRGRRWAVGHVPCPAQRSLRNTYINVLQRNSLATWKRKRSSFLLTEAMRLWFVRGCSRGCWWFQAQQRPGGSLSLLQPGLEKQQQKFLTHWRSVKTSTYLIFRLKQPRSPLICLLGQTDFRMSETHVSIYPELPTSGQSPLEARHIF